MAGIEKIIDGIGEKLGVKITYKRDTDSSLSPVPVTTDEAGEHTFFRFFYRNAPYRGLIDGAGEKEKNYALLLPAYIDSFSEREELTKTQFLKRILLDECSSADIYKYMMKFSVREGVPCFVIALELSALTEEALALAAQYGGNDMDTAVRMDKTRCVLVKFGGEEESEYRSATDYADFLTQSLKEELCVEVTAGVGSPVKSFKDVAASYAQAAAALRYARVFSSGGGVHSYKEYVLVKMLEDVPEAKLAEYFSEITDESSKEIFEDEEMLSTAEEFLQNSLNVSETSRKLYMHRNTLLYRLDKIEKATGLNIRQFSDAVSFRVLTILYRLLKK